MYKTTSSAILLLSLCTTNAAAQVSSSKNENTIHHTFNKDVLISRNHFSAILATALDDEVTWQHVTHYNNENHSKKNLRGRKNSNNNERRTADQIQHQESEENNDEFSEDEAWQLMIQHGWQLSSSRSHQQHRHLRPDNYTAATSSREYPHLEEKDEIILYPYLFCSQFENHSGYQRLQRIANALQADLTKTQTTSNTDEKSCFIVPTTADAIEKSYQESDENLANVTFGPLVDILKVAANTPYAILGESWSSSASKNVNAIRSSLKSNSTTAVAQEGWKQSILVDLIPGGIDLSYAHQILSDVKSMAQSGQSNAAPFTSSKLRSSSVTNPNDSPAKGMNSTREAFSLTSTLNAKNTQHKRLFRNRFNIWSQALAHGFEESHGCNDMFEMLQMRPRGEVVTDDSTSISGLELILTASSEEEGSALNRNCALSLVIGLSVHQSVQTIEVSQKLELATAVEGKSNPQWITQSGNVDRRPFFDKGLDGTGQIVSVADGGLDTDNCYFRDASNSPFGGWDISRRKIAHYDYSFGDRQERAKGHGTYVSGIVLGRKSTNGVDDEVGYADGAAPGSKISFFDMEIEANGIDDPGVSRLFSSFYNSGNGAFISNASWGRGYKGKYSSFCRDYDSALRSVYSDVLFVVSAGNTGMGGKEVSIQNPADCKSPLSVGASLSYGNDIRSREKGIEYLADYSSRGPTADGRIKPDIVAPGHFIVAPNADPSAEGECDGSSAPSIKSSIDAGTGVRYVSGTSMASPVVAGTAAIIRQYFEEGWCNSERCCGSKGCGTSMKPSGSLMKAVLMNGAQPLTGGVQLVPDGNVLSDQSLSEYDSNQGMGRINLLNSVPLEDENKIQLIAVNDQIIMDGDKDEYAIKIDTSNGCDSDLRVTLAWYDPPGAVGCMSCVVNDIDVYIEEIGGNSGRIYPNGLSQYDNKNTVERIRVSFELLYHHAFCTIPIDFSLLTLNVIIFFSQTSAADGQEFRVVVHARNFAFEREKYSLAITGCLADEAKQPDLTEAVKSSSICPNGELFEFELNAAENGQQIEWNIIGSTMNNGVEMIAAGPGAEDAYMYNNYQKYYQSFCLVQGTKYRFQIRNAGGSGVGSGSYSISYGGSVIFDSESSGDFGSVANHRFQVTSSGFKVLGGKTRSFMLYQDDEVL